MKKKTLNMRLKTPIRIDEAPADAPVGAMPVKAATRFLLPAENVNKAGLPAPLGSVNSGKKAPARAVGATNRAELKPASSRKPNFSAGVAVDLRTPALRQTGTTNATTCLSRKQLALQPVGLVPIKPVWFNTSPAHFYIGNNSRRNLTTPLATADALLFLDYAVRAAQAPSRPVAQGNRCCVCAGGHAACCRFELASRR